VPAVHSCGTVSSPSRRRPGDTSPDNHHAGARVPTRTAGDGRRSTLEGRLGAGPARLPPWRTTRVWHGALPTPAPRRLGGAAADVCNPQATCRYGAGTYDGIAHRGERCQACTKSAEERASEGQGTLYGTSYRAVVVHSSAQDKRRQQRLARDIQTSYSTIQTAAQTAEQQEYFCRADAAAAAARIRAVRAVYHRLEVTVEEQPVYGRGRPSLQKPRPIKAMRYRLKTAMRPQTERLARLEAEAGCFVLLTNVPTTGDLAHSARDILTVDKDQHGTEPNYLARRHKQILHWLAVDHQRTRGMIRSRHQDLVRALPGDKGNRSHSLQTLEARGLIVIGRSPGGKAESLWLTPEGQKWASQLTGSGDEGENDVAAMGCNAGNSV
jgi:DNA-binding MarR family transcriptional regulator